MNDEPTSETETDADKVRDMVRGAKLSTDLEWAIEQFARAAVAASLCRRELTDAEDAQIDARQELRDVIRREIEKEAT